MLGCELVTRDVMIRMRDCVDSDEVIACIISYLSCNRTMNVSDEWYNGNSLVLCEI